MTRTAILEHLGRCPVIPAVRDPGNLPAALASACPVVFLLASEIGGVVEHVYAARQAGKAIFVHFDLIAGLGKDAPALQWLRDMAEPTGIITTRAALIAPAKSLGLLSIQRTFLVDSQSVQAVVDQGRKGPPDFLEVMPGIAPEGIRMLAGRVACPIIGGGLVREEQHVRAALAAGAVAVSTSQEALWRWGAAGAE